MLSNVDAELLAELERQPGDADVTAHLARIQKLNTLKTHDLNRLSRRLWLKNESKRGQKASKEDRMTRAALASRQLRIDALSRLAELDRQAFELRGLDPVHESPNTIASLLSTELSCYSVRILSLN